jgi:uncharacterized membrane protein
MLPAPHGVKAPTMHKGRLEAFSDGVIAIIITIMVLELKAPHAETLEGLRPLIPAFLSYVLSFIYVGIYWNNHHHLLQAATRVSGKTLWMNLHFLFWLSLIPFVTHWMGESHFAARPVAAYGIVLLMCAFAWTMLGRVLVRSHASDSVIASAIAHDRKAWVSLSLYSLGIAAAAAAPLIAPEGARWPGIVGAITYGVVAAIWFVPDKRIERAIANRAT